MHVTGACGVCRFGKAVPAKKAAVKKSPAKKVPAKKAATKASAKNPVVKKAAPATEGFSVSTAISAVTEGDGLPLPVALAVPVFAAAYCYFAIYAQL